MHPSARRHHSGCHPDATAPPHDTAALVDAANAFLASLTDAQRAHASYRFDDDAQRARWSNFPTAVVPRGGVPLKDLSAPQRAAAMALLTSALSARGLEKVQQIMDADEVLKTTEGDHPPPGGPPGGGHPPGGAGGPPPGSGPRPGGPGAGGPPFGGGPLFGKDLYYLCILGAPSDKTPWMVQFGGHHLALNLTIAGERGVLTPSLTGAQPALYESQGKTIRPLGAENDKAFALLAALNDSQRQRAILAYRVADLVLGPGHDGQTIPPEGLPASSLDEAQRAKLLDLIAEWASIANDRFARARMADLGADLDATWFAWSGPTTVEAAKNGTAYYRIQGPKLVIEYAPQGERGDPSLHVHTIYRDPTNDYGRTLAVDEAAAGPIAP